MGCWNATCQLSNLPIFRDEEVIGIVVAITDSISPSGMTYLESHTVFALSYPIHGTYNEVGGINYEEQSSVDILYEMIYKNINNEKPSPYSKSFYRLHRGTDDSLDYSLSLAFASNKDIETSINNKNFLDKELPCKKSFINELISQDQIVMTEHGKIYRIGLCLIKKDVYSSILMQGKFKEEFDFINKKIEEYPILFLDEENATKEELKSYFLSLSQLSSYFFYIPTSSKNKEYFQTKILSYKEAFNTSFEEAADILLNNLKELLYIQTIMETFRKSWLPNSGSGSQEYDGFEKHTSFLLAMNDALINIKKQNIDEDWDDE